MRPVDEIKAAVIIPSAGKGSRMGGRKKNYLPLSGRPVLAHTLEPFNNSPLVKEIILVVPDGDIDFCSKEIVERYGFSKVTSIVPGGKERQDSVINGLDAVSGNLDIIAIHDGARALVTTEIVEATLRAAFLNGAAVCAVPLKDTIKEVTPEAADGVFIARTVTRDTLRAVQTPQAFKPDIINRAYQEAASSHFVGTDSSSLVERLGIRVAIVEGSYENIKITTPDDIIVAGEILRCRQVCS